MTLENALRGKLHFHETEARFDEEDENRTRLGGQSGSEHVGGFLKMDELQSGDIEEGRRCNKEGDGVDAKRKNRIFSRMR